MQAKKKEDMNKATVLGVLRLMSCGAIVGVAVSGLFGGGTGAELVGATVGGGATLLMKVLHFI
jgi:hypothetical protein